MIPAQRRPSAPSFPSGDPRSRTDGLGWVTRAVFADPALRLSISDDPQAAVRYAVIPSLDQARFLLPLASRRVTAAALLTYNALRPPRVRLSRAAIGLVARAGALGVLRAPVLSVHGGPLLWDHLAGLLGVERLHAAVGIRPPDPHHKPTLQLFDDEARPRGYAKIGWNDGTRAMVRAEVATLTGLPAPGDGFPAAPPLMLHTRWQNREVAVIEPMPRSVRRIRRPDRPRLAAMLAVARRGGPPGTPRPLTGSPFLAACRHRATAAIPARTSPAPSTAAASPTSAASSSAAVPVAPAASPGPAAARAPRHAAEAVTVEAAIDALEARDGTLTVEFGAWHGDWVPWNMARHRGRLLVWDWENHGTAAPVGFDLAHQAFQTALSTHRRPAHECVTAVDGALRAHGPALGLDPARQRLVADAYLIELWLRTYELSHGGAGWNPRLHPALLQILATRLT